MDSCENIVNREIKRRLLLENMYPQKTDFHIWKSQICQKFDIDNNSVEDVMLGSQLASTIRKKLRTQISAYLDTNFAKHKVPFLHGIAQGNNESPPSDKSIYLTDVQHLPLAYKNHAKLPGSSNTPGYRPDFPPQGRPIPTEFDGAQLSGLLQNTDVISQVFFVAFIRPWTGMIKESFVQQADLLDMKKWNVRMLVAAISLVSYLWSVKKKKFREDIYLSVIIGIIIIGSN